MVVLRDVVSFNESIYKAMLNDRLENNYRSFYLNHIYLIALLLKI